MINLHSIKPARTEMELAAIWYIKRKFLWEGQTFPEVLEILTAWTESDREFVMRVWKKAGAEIIEL